MLLLQNKLTVMHSVPENNKISHCETSSTSKSPSRLQLHQPPTAENIVQKEFLKGIRH